jgi:branched-chain amino acid transport system substrate-binding protein
MNRRGFISHLLAGCSLAAWTLVAGMAVMPSASAQQPSGPPLKIGWLAALTGPNSSPGIGFDRGIKWAAEQINKAGGVKGRPIEIVTRDTQGDPTKAVNAAIELINQQKVEFTIGPTNSGEALATGPVIARYKVPNLGYGVVDRLIDVEKFPHAFRVLPSNQQWTDAAHRYVLNNLGVKKIAIIGDATGYGTATVDLSDQELRKLGADVVYKGLVEANQTDVSADMQKARAAGAQVLLVWSDSAGLNSRLMNARGDLGWDVPLVGHPALGAGSVKPLLKKPEYWDKVYIVGYRTMSFDADGHLPARTQKFLDEVSKSVDVHDTTLWWVAAGNDAVQLIRQAVETSGSSKGDDVKKAWETLKDFSGIFGTYTYTPTIHNGYRVEDVAMNAANSFKNGAYSLAPGYK